MELKKKDDHLSNGDIFWRRHATYEMCLCILFATPIVDRRNIFAVTQTQLEDISTVRNSQNSRIVIVP